MPTDDSVPSRQEEGAIAAPAGSETVLIVDDEPLVLRLCCSILSRQGYEVLGANSAGEALEICASNGRNVRLLLSDIVMPQMRGTELAVRFREINPEIRVLFMSGFDGREIPEYQVLQESAKLIPKPFTPAQLLVAVRAALDKPPGL